MNAAGPSASGPSAAGSNPFSTRFVRPGALAYRFPAGVTAEQLVDRLAVVAWRGQIVGPHGSGKSTLLAELLPALQKAGRRVLRFDLHDGEHRLPSGWRELARSGAANLIIVDGYEQVSVCRRNALERHAQREGRGLLVTTHRDLGLPTLVQTVSRLETLQILANELMAGRAMALPSNVVAECFEQAGGNMRESLFLLYDRWEQRAPAG